MAHADLVLANRSYLDHDTPPGGPAGQPAAGGLLAALRPVIVPGEDGRGTTWIGAARGRHDRVFVDAEGRELVVLGDGTLRHRRLFFDQATWNRHYASVANDFLWPLLHLVRPGILGGAIGYPTPALPQADDWASYTAVNRAFADAALQERTSGTAWIHDYQLALTPRMLREAGAPFRIGFFLHTPFPALDALVALPTEARGFLRDFVLGVLGADLVGLQSADDLERFVGAASELTGAQCFVDRVMTDGRRVRTGVFPVGIDAAAVDDAPAGGAFALDGLPVVVGLERCDFTKGIPERLRAIAAGYRSGLNFRYTGVAAPTREDVPSFREFARRVEDEARASADAGGDAFQHRTEAMDWKDVVVLERRADVLFASSLADGLNLVPLQTAIAQEGRPRAERAALIAGRDSGVVAAFGRDPEDGITSVDPLDPAAMLDVLTRGVRGQLPRVSDRLIREIRRRSAHAWASDFLDALEAHE